MRKIINFWQKGWWSKLILIGIGLFLWPFAIGGCLSFLIAKKIKIPLIKWLLILPIVAFSLILGGPWVIAITSPQTYKSEPKPVHLTIPSPPSTPSPSPSPTPVSESLPTVTPTLIPTVEPTIIPTVKPTTRPTIRPTVLPTPPVSSETISQKNAVKKAKSYLGYSAFSHDGLVAQLEYEKFPHEDAVYGADNSGANWNEQAAKKAKSYMEYSAFSRGSLIEQLKYEKFTQEQAEYGANAVGL